MVAPVARASWRAGRERAPKERERRPWPLAFWLEGSIRGLSFEMRQFVAAETPCLHDNARHRGSVVAVRYDKDDPNGGN